MSGSGAMDSLAGYAKEIEEAIIASTGLLPISQLQVNVHKKKGGYSLAITVPIGSARVKGKLYRGTEAIRCMAEGNPDLIMLELSKESGLYGYEITAKFPEALDLRREAARSAEQLRAQIQVSDAIFERAQTDTVLSLSSRELEAADLEYVNAARRAMVGPAKRLAQTDAADTQAIDMHEEELAEAKFALSVVYKRVMNVENSRKTEMVEEDGHVLKHAVTRFFAEERSRG